MKIRYILIHYDNDENGVLKKALNQTFFLKRIGVDIELILITSEKFSLESFNYVKIREINRCNNSYLIHRLKRARQISEIIKRIIAQKSSVVDNFICSKKGFYAELDFETTDGELRLL